MTLLDYARANAASFPVLSESTNRVSRFSCGGEEYILKECLMDEARLSPFWRTMREAFGWQPLRQIAALPEIARLAGANGAVPVVGPVCVSEALHIYPVARGVAWEPDEFPPSPSACEQLGAMLGATHAAEYSRFGEAPAPTREREAFPAALLGAMRRRAAEHWQGRQDVSRAIERAAAQAAAPASFSLIMPDISANQFLFSPDRAAITAAVDLDAYVVGPREWELSVVEMCMPDDACARAFLRGYERHGPFGGIGGVRALYRLAMYLCDPWDAPPLDAFLSDGVRFP